MSATLNLITHCGAEKVEREQVLEVITPQSTPSWAPLPHHRLIDQVELALDNCGLTVVNQAHALGQNSRDGKGRFGDRYFGLFQVARKQDVGNVQLAEVLESGARGFSVDRSRGDDYSWVLGLRNSHDQTYAAGLVLGAQVFVCDNLSFSGEEKISRKHTVFCERDLPKLVSRAVGRLVNRWHDNDVRFEAYKTYELADREAHDLIIRALDNGAIVGSQVPKVLKEYRTPRHPEFAESKTIWRLFNAVTEVAKENSLFALPQRTEALHGLLDGHCGLALAN